MSDGKPTARVFKYEKPAFGEGKQIVKLARTDRMLANLQVLKEGGDNNLHAHGHLDGFWMLLGGRARLRRLPGRTHTGDQKERSVDPTRVSGCAHVSDKNKRSPFSCL